MTPAANDAPEIRARIDLPAEPLAFGAVVEARLVIDGVARERVIPLAPADAGGFVLLDCRPDPERADAFRLKLLPVASDVATLPALSIEFEDASGARSRIETKAVDVDVASVDPEAPRAGAPGAGGAPVESLDWIDLPERTVPWGMLAGVALCVAIAAAFALRRRRARTQVAATIARPPHDAAREALAALDDIAARGALSGADRAALLGEIADVLRRLLAADAAHDSIALLALTSEELIALLAEPALAPAFSDAERAKYAGVAPGPDGFDRHLAAARAFVRPRLSSVGSAP